MAGRVDAILRGTRRQRGGVFGKPLRDFTGGDLLRLMPWVCVVIWTTAVVAFFVCLALLMAACFVFYGDELLVFGL